MIDLDVVVNDKKVNSDLARMEYALSGPVLSVLLDTGVTPIMWADAERRFATEGASDGDPWVPLKDSTLRIRAERGFPYPTFPINVRTGRLREFVTTAGADTMVVGDYVQSTWPGERPMTGDLMYAYATAQAGSTRWRTPPRPVVRLSPEAIVSIYTLLASHVGRAVRGAKL